MAEYSVLVQTAIREAQQTAAEQRKKATVSETKGSYWKRNT